MVDDLSSYLLTTDHRFCQRCVPCDDKVHKAKVNLCAVCEAYYCRCRNCTNWLNDYATDYTVLCICEARAMQRIEARHSPVTPTHE